MSRRSSPVRLRTLFLLSLACALAVSVSSIIQAQEASSATIRGTVLNSVTREPVARALVTSPDNRFAALTDDQGNFSFTVPAPGAYAESFHAGRPDFLEDEGSQIAANVTSKAAHPDLLFTLTPESLIVGRVNLPSAGSYDRIRVELYRREVSEGRGRWQMQATVTARASGDFRFAGLRAGSYKVFTSELLDHDPLNGPGGPDAQLVGYPPAYFPTASDFGSAATITLAAGQTFQAELTPTLRPYYNVRIFLPNLAPGQGVNVTVAPYNHPGPGFTLGYNGQRQTIEGMLPNGTYTVEAISYGPKISSGVTTFTVHDAPSLTSTLMLLPSQEIPVLVKEEFSKSNAGDSGEARIRIRDGSGPYLAYRSRLNMHLFPANDFFTQVPSLVPDTNGNGMHLSDVLPGAYWLRIFPRRGYVASATSAGVDLLLNPLVVGPGGSSAPIEITLRDDTAEIHASIEDSSPEKRTTNSFPFVYCIPLPDSPGTLEEASTQTAPSADISIDCPNLAPGSYRVLAFEHQQPEFEFHDPEAMRPYESKGPVVRVAAGQTESIRIPLNP